jgi:hypothetical protein
VVARIELLSRTAGEAEPSPLPFPPPPAGEGLGWGLGPACGRAPAYRSGGHTRLTCICATIAELNGRLAQRALYSLTPAL